MSATSVPPSPGAISAASLDRGARLRARVRRAETWAFPITAALVLAATLLVHGLVPGLVNDTPWNYIIEGNMRCLDGMGASALTSWCDAYGQPTGYPFLSSGPIVFLGWALMVVGLDSYAAYLVAGGAFDAVALAGGYGLLRMLGVSRAVALGASFVYLVAPTTVGLRFFGGTFTGFALLPAYALADLVVMRLVRTRRRNILIAAVLGYAFVRTGALFMDGYSFVASGLLSALLWLQWAVTERKSAARTALGAATLLGANLVAFGVYTAYTPSLAIEMPLGIYRSMGLDLATAVLPTDQLWGWSAVGATADHTDLWGDGSNSAHNYLGAVTILLAVLAVATRHWQRHVLPFAAAAVAAFVLSLGPSVKVDEIKPLSVGSQTFESYLMPDGAAAVDLPWSSVFTGVPGVEEMRATYRWSAVTRLALIVLAALALDQLWRRRRARWRVLAVVLAAIGVAELAPNVPLLAQEYRQNYLDRERTSAAVIGDLQRATAPADRVFFLSPDAHYNDYMVNYLAATAGVQTYNAGGDKNVTAARARWPEPILALADDTATPDDVHRALQSGAADAVIAPYFHLRWDTYGWPPPDEERAAAIQRFAPILEDKRFSVRRYPWFATIRPAASARGVAGER